jgi:hypothetical protein
VSTELLSENLIRQTYSIASGASTKSILTKRIRIQIQDPGQLASYAVITGPGLPSSGFKMLSPRLLNTDPRLANSPKYVNLPNGGDWFICEPTTYENSQNDQREAQFADCVNSPVNWPHKATSRTFDPGSSTSAITAASDVDAAFKLIGFQAGGSYTIKIYADDGWSKINGQLGKTPIAIYTKILNSLPYSFSDQISTATTNYWSLNNFNASSFYNQLKNNAELTINYTPATSNPVIMGSTEKLSWGGVWVDREGTVMQVLADNWSNYWPETTRETDIYMVSKPTGSSSLVSPAPGGSFVSPTYFGAAAWYGNRNNSSVQVRIEFQ